MDLEKYTEKILEMMKNKASLNCDIYDAIQKRDRKRLIEIVIENVVDDIQNFGHMRYALGLDPSKPLDDIQREAMKQVLLKILVESRQ